MTSTTRTLTSPGRRPIVAVLSVLVSIGLLALVVRRVEIGETWRHLRQLDPRWLIMPLAASVGSLGLRAWRWQQIFPAGARPGLGASFRVLALGNLLNLILPARAGDVVRCVAAGRGRSEANTGTALAVLGLEKILDGLTTLLILVVASQALDPPVWFRHLRLVAALLFLGALAALMVLHRQATLVFDILRVIARRLGRERLGERIVGLTRTFLTTLDVVTSPAQAAALALLTGGVWLAEAVGVLGLAVAVGVWPGVSGAAVTSSVVALATMIPSAPGYVGTYEFFSASALEMFSIAPARALALTLVMHAWVYAVIVGVGLLAYLGGGIAWLRAVTLAGIPRTPRVPRHEGVGLVAVPMQVCEAEVCRTTES